MWAFAGTAEYIRNNGTVGILCTYKESAAESFDIRK